MSFKFNTTYTSKMVKFRMIFKSRQVVTSHRFNTSKIVRFSNDT